MARKMWTEWLVHFAKRSGDKLAAYTVVELIASISFFFYVQVCVAMVFLKAVFVTGYSEKKNC